MSVPTNRPARRNIFDFLRRRDRQEPAAPSATPSRPNQPAMPPPAPPRVTPTSSNLFLSLRYLEAVLVWRLQQVFGVVDGPLTAPVEPPILATQDPDPFTRFYCDADLDAAELLVLMTALAPELDPTFFDRVIEQTMPRAGDFPQLGGVRGKQSRSFLPTGETVLFLLAGNDLAQRLAMQHYLSADHLFARQHVLWLAEAPDEELRMSGRVVISPDYANQFLLGKVPRPRMSLKFPAQRIETEMTWDDLVLSSETLAQVRDLEKFLQHNHTLLHEWGMGRKLKPGYRVLFHGPPGTGKTLTASLLGKSVGLDTYRIDLSMVVSKYIGETEKNLANLFATAENKNWILFFDEADALFGKRTNVRDAHDKYANQEVSYLLQRIEHYDGLVILATNFKNNIDTAFMRRFQSIIHFPFPAPTERLRIWQLALPEPLALHPDVQLSRLAQQHELSGAEIMNITQYCCLRVLDRGDGTLTTEDLYRGIRHAYAKEGKSL